jgi:hypothetical protein
MVKVFIEVRSGGAYFDVAVQDGSIQRAISVVSERCPEGNVRVRLPIEPESFFVEDPTPRTGKAGLELPARVAASLRSLPAPIELPHRTKKVGGSTYARRPPANGELTLRLYDGHDRVRGGTVAKK